MALKEKPPLALALRFVREALELTQQEWAAELEVTSQSVYRWESGAQEPSRSHLSLIRYALRNPAMRAAINRYADLERVLVSYGLIVPMQEIAERDLPMLKGLVASWQRTLAQPVS
jgi:DNA-binding XRE family transcriptional regulator